MPGKGHRPLRRIDRQQHLLQAVSRTAAYSFRGFGDDRDHHREPADHHRSVLDDPAGNPARLAAAPANHPEDLCRRHQLAAQHCCGWPKAVLRQVRQCGRRTSLLEMLIAFAPVVTTALLDPFQAAIAVGRLVGIVLVKAGMHAALAGGFLGVFRIDRGGEDRGA
jgi:hypothetical protein